MNFKHIWSLFNARNKEFFRDKGSLAWSLMFPFLLLGGFAMIFSGDNKTQFTVGYIQTEQQACDIEFCQQQYIKFVAYQDRDTAIGKVREHSLDLLFDSQTNNYWRNQDSAKGYIAAELFVAKHQDYQLAEVTGKAIRYVDWVLPGVIGMNVMFGCLFGIGYVIVRYRQNSILKRLSVTPVTAIEFITAQMLSRLILILLTAGMVLFGALLILGATIKGSYLLLFAVIALGAMSMITLSLVIAARSESPELTNGLLNFFSWPMMMLSNVWFSLEGAPQWLQSVASALPLTHMVDASRAVMLENASVADIQHNLVAMLAMTVIFTVIGAKMFNWQSETR